MWYNVLLTGDAVAERPLFLSENTKEEIEIPLYYFFRASWGNPTWKKAFREFEQMRNVDTLSDYYFLNLVIVVRYKFLGVVEDNKLRILINETNENVYVDKYFERDYRKLFLKFKNILLSLHSSSKDIIYTENAGKNSFYQFEKPKFKSISERKEYIELLLNE